MMINQKKKPLMFGDLIEAIYTAFDKQKANRVVRLAINAHLVEFRGDERFEILEPGPS
ncbi:MAG: hypothetical protein WAO21_03075 [Verrucomicrobiia bacterium]|jgi:hypothetical protein